MEFRNPGESLHSRRGFLAAAAGGAVAIGSFSSSAALAAAKSQTGRQLVTPAEDLMSEHGLIERLLLIYNTAAARQSWGPRSTRAVPAHRSRRRDRSPFCRGIS